MRPAATLPWPSPPAPDGLALRRWHACLPPRNIPAPRRHIRIRRQAVQYPAHHPVPGPSPSRPAGRSAGTVLGGRRPPFFGPRAHGRAPSAAALRTRRRSRATSTRPSAPAWRVASSSAALGSSCTWSTCRTTSRVSLRSVWMASAGRAGGRARGRRRRSLPRVGTVWPAPPFCRPSTPAPAAVPSRDARSFASSSHELATPPLPPTLQARAKASGGRG